MRAVDGAGNVDPTAAKDKFKVVGGAPSEEASDEDDEEAFIDRVAWTRPGKGCSVQMDELRRHPPE